MYIMYVSGCVLLLMFVRVRGVGARGIISVLYLYIEAACNRYNPTWISCIVWTGIVHRIHR